MMPVVFTPPRPPHRPKLTKFQYVQLETEHAQLKEHMNNLVELNDKDHKHWQEEETKLLVQNGALMSDNSTLYKDNKEFKQVIETLYADNKKFLDKMTAKDYYIKELEKRVKSDKEVIIYWKEHCRKVNYPIESMEKSIIEGAMDISYDISIISQIQPEYFPETTIPDPVKHNCGEVVVDHEPHH